MVLVPCRFPHITVLGCTAHIMDLLLEDIGKEKWAKEAIVEGKALVTFVRKHHLPRALFRKYSKVALLKPGDTRFATAYLMIKRLRDTKTALLSMVNDPEFVAWADKPRNKQKATQVSSTQFW